MQTCIWPSWCHCHSLSLTSVKSRLVLPFWYQLTWVVPEKGPLNGCVCVCVCVWSALWTFLNLCVFYLSLRYITLRVMSESSKFCHILSWLVLKVHGRSCLFFEAGQPRRRLRCIGMGLGLWNIRVLPHVTLLVHLSVAILAISNYTQQYRVPDTKRPTYRVLARDMMQRYIVTDC